MVTTNTTGDWKSAEGTVAEIRTELNSDAVTPEDVRLLTYDNSNSNVVAIYWVGHK